MTFFGLIWIFLIIVSILTQKKNLIFLLLLGMLLQRDSIIIIGNLNVGVQIFTTIAYLFITLFPLKLKITFKLKTQMIACIILIGAIFYSLYMNNINSFETSLYFVMLICYMLCALRLLNESKKYTVLQIENMVYIIIGIIAILGIIQFLMFTNTVPKFTILKVLFWNEWKEFYSLYYPRVCSTFMEPSYFAPFAVGSFYYLCCTFRKTKVHIFLMILLLIDIILTKSSTAYGCLLIGGVIYLFITKNYKALRILIPAAGIVLIVVSQFTNLLDEVIYSKMSTGSGVTRARHNKEAWLAFRSAPMHGVGFNQWVGSSIANKILGELGIVGAVSYVFYMITVILPGFDKHTSKSKQNHKRGALMFLLMSCCGQLIGVPDIFYCGTWFSIYLMCISYENTEN